MLNELKACPFCGAEDARLLTRMDRIDVSGLYCSFIECNHCHAQGPWTEDDHEGSDAEKAVIAWNSRG